MAEESTTKKNTFEDMFFTLFFLFIIAHMVSRIPIFIEEKFGIDIAGSQVGLSAAALDRETPLGTKVTAVNGAEYAELPGGVALGKWPPGTQLVLEDGPRTLGFKRAWQVREEGTDTIGWVPEGALVIAGFGGIDGTTQLGTRVRAILGTDLYDVPAGNEATGRMEEGDTGTLADGPENAHNGHWWFVDKDDSRADGWVSEAALARATNKDLRIGRTVDASEGVDLFEEPGGGRVTGFFSKGSSATIEDGPVGLGGAFWWQVETEQGDVGWVTENVLELGGVRGFWKTFTFVFIIVMSILAVALLVGLLYVTLRTNQIRARETRRIREALPKAIEPLKNERWDQVLRNASSDNPNDWRLAIIEADIMLDELVTRMGYHGATLGEKLKQVARGDMQSLDSAWDAHKVRNQIAHAGSDFILTHREARRVIDLYGEVFKEFKYI